MKHRYLFLIFTLLFSCTPHLDISDLYEAPLYVDRFVAIGDMYSAGTSNRGWSYDGSRGLNAQGQESSIPALMAGQFQQFRDFRFNQPTFTGTTGNQVFVSYQQAICPVLPALDSLSWDTATINWSQVNWQVPLDNLAIPGMRICDWEQSSPGFPVSPILERMAGPGRSYKNYLAENPADFYTVWLGMEDILYSATAGMAFPERQPLSGTAFGEKMESLLLSLASPDGKPRIVVGLLPDVTNFPYFTQQPYRWLEARECFVQYLDIYIQTSSQGVRIATPEDRILLPARYWIGKQGANGRQGLVANIPLPDSLVLDTDERQTIQQLVQSYNNGIRSLVADMENQYPSTKFAVASLDPVFSQIANFGIRVDGLSLSSDYLLGNVFSLDGLTFTPRGNALVANQWIKAINQTPGFQAKVPPLDLAGYSGILFP